MNPLDYLRHIAGHMHAQRADLLLRHAQACETCGSIPDPHTCPSEQLCDLGQLLRTAWERAGSFHSKLSADQDSLPPFTGG